MAFELKPAKPLPAEIHRLMSEQIQRIDRHLRSSDTAGKRIHDARKRIKECRALLRLLRPALGAQFAIENVWYGSVARDLAHARDAEALIESAESLRKRATDPSARRRLGRVRRALRERANHNGAAEGHIANLLAQMPYAEARLVEWPEFEDRFATIGDGIERTFRAGRRALGVAVRDYSPDHFHQFRKRVKDHWYQAQLLRRIWPDVMQPYTDVVADLAETLGNHHDLIVLRQTLTETPADYGDDVALQAAFGAIEEWRNELEKKALTLAGPIYSEKPSQWRRRIRGYWQIAAKTRGHRRT